MNQPLKKGSIKLSGLLSNGAIPQADERVVNRMFQLTTAEQIAAQSTSTSLNDQHAGEHIIDVPLSLIDRSPYQPRLRIDACTLASLASSIEAGDLIEPVILRRTGGDRFELIAGERRWMAHRELGRNTIRALIKDVDDRGAALMAGTDNTAREDLHDYELGKYFHMLLERKFVRNVAEIVCNATISRAQVDRCLDYIKLPGPVLNMLDETPGLFGATTAEIFAKYCGEDKGDLVVKAATMIRDQGSTEQQAIAWIERFSSAATSGAKTPKESTTIQIGGQSIGQARVERSKLVITCAKGTKPTDLLQSIVAALQMSR